MLRHFFRDLTVLRRCRPVLSERIQNRYLDRAIQITPRTTPEDFENALLNTIAEYVLASLGVVDPNLFELSGGHFSHQDQAELAADLQRTGIITGDIRNLFAEYKRRPEKTLFWNRWKTLHKQPSTATDLKVRDFITRTVRAQREEILAAIGYHDTFFREAQTIATTKGKSKTETREILKDELRTQLIEAMTHSDLLATLLRLARDEWYAELDVFYDR